MFAIKRKRSSFHSPNKSYVSNDSNSESDSRFLSLAKSNERKYDLSSFRDILQKRYGEKNLGDIVTISNEIHKPSHKKLEIQKTKYDDKKKRIDFQSINFLEKFQNKKPRQNLKMDFQSFSSSKEAQSQYKTPSKQKKKSSNSISFTNSLNSKLEMKKDDEISTFKKIVKNLSFNEEKLNSLMKKFKKPN